MRSYSFFTIVLLCLAILAIDILAFMGLRSILEHTNLLPLVKIAVKLVFWIFTIGLITAILVLKSRMDSIHVGRKQLLISRLYGLTISSFVPKIIFVFAIAIIYFTNSLSLNSNWMIFVIILALLSGLLPFFAIIYAIFKAAYRFKIHNIEIVFENLPKKFEGLKIVQISDIHIGSFNYRYKILEKAVNQINDLEPDLIFFTGDMVNNYAWELKGWAKVFKKLKAKRGKFAVLGNHDYGDYSQWKTKKAKQSNFESIKYFFKKIDFTLLMNDAVVISKESEEIVIVGVENWGKPPFKQYGNLDKALETGKFVSFKILLSHDPSHWAEEVIEKTDIALTLSGHTHGMQAGFNLKNKEWSPIKYKYKHWAGLYKHKNQYLYVNRGLGWLGFPGRLGMRPEITLIELMSND
ncbi:metallophosphoesterase [Aureibaculum sp. 2210JD6-5]|uniref:metallophosphoesterase n=1 Tax=Aureibaculum sp. 2210JD6-5 TaxID=3103957 RepID=UPI002AAE2AB2|nr:metallophosphoesterase [Aureibaculum sp. 2210JD6-5]MDY7396560.1 metallophosphoesterase [Aureibaculum sp. 2210JD6-5]